MFSRRMIISLALGFIAALAVLWHITNVPARVTIVNQSGRTVRDASLQSGRQTITLRPLRNGESRVLSISGGARVTLVLSTEPRRSWTSEHAIRPAESLVLYLLPQGKVDARNRLGTFSPDR